MSLALYKPLTENSESVRLTAAKQLIEELSTILSGDRDEKAKSDIDYALKRLTRGLASGRESARPGFAVVLTEFLSTLLANGDNEKWSITLADAIDAVKSNTTPQGHSSGQEGRDYALGRLFGLQSLVQSNILFADEAALEKYAEVLDLVLELAQKKPWLKESCAWAIAGSVVNWPEATAKVAVGITYEKLKATGFAKTGEGVGIWLALQSVHPDVNPPKDVWSKDSPLAAGNLGKLAKVLKESHSKEDLEGGKAKGSWNPKLSFTWDYVLALYFSEEKQWKELRAKEGAVAPWEEFWRVAVDESLFSSSSSEERKYWGFLFFLKSLDIISTTTTLSTLFSKNLMRSFINQLSDSERYLHKIATKVSRTLISKSESSPWMSPVIFKNLISGHGPPNFDHITKTKTVDKVLCNADENGLNEIFDDLRNIILDPVPSAAADEEASENNKQADSRRQWATDTLLSAIRSGKTPKDEKFLRRTVELLTMLGYFTITSGAQKPKSPVSESSQGMFRTRLMSCLTHLIGLNSGKTSTGESWPYLAIKKIQKCKDAEDEYKPAVEADEMVEEVVEGASKTVEKLRKKRTAAVGTVLDTQLLAFEMLYSLIILQVYNGESDAVAVLDDLKSVQKQLLSSSSTSSKESKKKSSHEEEDDEDLDPSEILLDILLSFLSRQSILLKKLAQMVFTAFAPSVTSRALERCFDVLRTNEGLGGQQELFEEEDDDADLAAAEAGSDDEDEDNELDSDVEMIDAGADGELDSDVEAVSEATDDDESSGDEDEEDGEPDASTLALEAALKTALDIPSDADSDSDADMSDSAMLELDSTISRIFAQRKAAASKKSQQKDAKELIINFKSKVLELLELFVKNHPLKRETWDVVVPCLLLAAGGREGTRDPKVAERALGVVRAWGMAVKKLSNSSQSSDDAEEDVKTESLVELLETLLSEEIAGKVTKKTAKTVSSAAITASKILLRFEKDNMALVVGVYADALKVWALERGGVTEGGVFSDFVGWVGSLKKDGGAKQEEEKEKEAEDGDGEGEKNGKGKGKKNGGKKKQLAEQPKADGEDVKAANGNGGKRKRKRGQELEVRAAGAEKEVKEGEIKKRRRGGKKSKA
ncbi:hypothetical protein EX30DRAFT_314548 [Ascodesmis nigricans]|uniref:DNA polymerase V n=1 Tax=Ascodesmis nigricans TaxID=341454 RepID=A0A4S2N865_9PEZI|nr:hypothetical protein EX30DRAFT_314548 [Ascodesmis nigricans]